MKVSKCPNILCLFGLQFLAICGIVTAQNDPFHGFLNYTMGNFPEWLDKNNDHASPSQFLDLSDRTGRNNISCTLSNLALTGATKLNVISISGDLLKGKFSIGYCVAKIEVVGDYKINGTLMGALPVTGSGKATVTYNSDGNCILYDGRFEIDDFNASETGYVDLTNARIYQYLSLYSSDFQASLEGLIASGFESDVTSMFRQRVGLYNDDILPIKNQTAAYFKEVFETTPISEMIVPVTAAPTTTLPTSSEQPPPENSSNDPSQPTESTIPTRPTISTTPTIETTTAAGGRTLPHILITIVMILAIAN